MTRSKLYRVLRGAAYIEIVSLVCIAWSFLDPHPIAVVVGMVIGQGLGAAGILIFAIAVIADLRRTRLLPPSHQEREDVGPGDRDT